MMNVAETPNLDLKLLDQLFASTPDDLYIKDRESRFLWANQALLRRLQCRNMDEILGKTDFDYFPEESARGYFNDEQDVVKSGIPLVNKLEKHFLKNGRTGRTLTTKVPVRNEQGQIIGIMGISRDMADVYQLQDELELERNLMRNFMESSDDSIYFKDLQSRFIRCSRIMIQRFGNEQMQDFTGKTDFDIFDEEHAREAFEDEQEIIRTGKPIFGKQEREIATNGQVSWALTSKLPLRDADGEIIGTFGISKNITELKETEQELEQTHKQLLEASRQAGMAEIATNVLHNVGNVLNSVNVSSSLVVDGVKKLKIDNLDKCAELLANNADNPDFLNRDEKGKQLPGYLRNLAKHLADERKRLLEEMHSLEENIIHLKDIVVMQQSYATISGVVEKAKAEEIVETAIRINTGALARHKIELVREFKDVPEIEVDKHKVLQILVNLIRNAKHACDDSGNEPKKIRIQIDSTDAEQIQIRVIDNGIGIHRENLLKIFSHGFTTRKKGHGFGLHSASNTAKELGGGLTAASDGPGQGAVFTLTLPLRPPR